MNYFNNIDGAQGSGLHAWHNIMPNFRWANISVSALSGAAGSTILNTMHGVQSAFDGC